MPTTRLGVFELLVLMAVAASPEEADGVTIRQAVAAGRGRDVSSGAVHTTLERLEHRGLVTSRRGDTSPARGGRPRRYYGLTALGTTAIDVNYGALQTLARRVPKTSPQ
jgi:DNA-binding PadR family transcriptional regulator